MSSSLARVCKYGACLKYDFSYLSFFQTLDRTLVTMIQFFNIQYRINQGPMRNKLVSYVRKLEPMNA
jgi:hypothetical protein